MSFRVFSNRKKIGDYICWSAFVIICAVVLCCWIRRVPYGTDNTDTAYWTVEPYLMLKGAVPFANNWSQTPLTSILIAPLVAIVSLVLDGNEGIVLAMRYVEIIMRVLFAGVFWFALSRRVDRRLAAFVALLFSLEFSLNYYGLASANEMIALALVYSAPVQREKSAIRLYFSAGVFMALAVLAHSMQIVVCLYLAVIIFVLDRRTLRRLPLFSYFVFGGMAVAFIIVIWLEILGGGGLFSGLLIDLKWNNYFKIPAQSIKSGIVDVLWLLWRYGQTGLMLVSGVMVLLIVGFRVFSKRKLESVVYSSFVLSVMIVIVVYSWWNAIFHYSDNYGIAIVFIQNVSLFAWFLIFDKRDRIDGIKDVVYWCLPSSLFVLMITLIFHGDIVARMSLLFPGIFAAALMVERAWKYVGADTSRRSICLAVMLMIILPQVLSLTLNNGTSVYRDDDISLLTYKVSSGVYKGCLTSEDRGHRLERLEARIADISSENETILFADLFPPGYLMTEAQPCTPSCWDPCHYRYHFQDAALYLKYFERVQKTPDKIVFVASEPETGLSVDDEDNEFAAWVKSNYLLTEEFGEGMFSFRVFSKIQ